MRLLLIRHAAAEERCDRRWPDDRRRPLTDRGRGRFVGMVRTLRERLGSIELNLASSFDRAWETAELLARHAGAPAPQREPALELGGAAAMVEAIVRRATVAPATSIALVGHEPDLSELATALVVGPGLPVAFRMRKGAILTLRFDSAIDDTTTGRPSSVRPTLGQAIVEWMVYPKLVEVAGRRH